ncbi:class D sortase [Sporosarcina sp. CAU 1771]
MRKTKTILGILFLLAGVVLISIPFYQEWNQSKDLNALEEALSLISTDESTVNDDSDESSVAEPIDLSTIENLPFTEDEIKDVMELEIPFIDLKQYILNKTTDYNLSVALTQIKTDQTPGVGNFTIAGHRGFRDGRHFSNLAKVPVGEMVYLHADGKTYVYEIKSSEVVEPTYIEVLNDTANKDEITLITCTVSGADRVAVKGDLVDSY